MSTRMRMFFWEQRRLLNWVLGAAAFSVMGSVIGSILLKVPNSLEDAQAAGWLGRLLYMTLTQISDKDAVELADGYAMIALLLMLFGALVPESTRVQIDLPNRLLRLPMGSMRLAWAWVTSRVAIVAVAMLVVLVVRHAFVNLPSTLVFLPALCYYVGGFLLFQGVARIVSAWREHAAVVVIIGLAALLGFVEKPLWELTIALPFIPLLLGALIGLPLAVTGILLRRRGGIVFGLDAQGLFGRGEEYRHVADLPSFSSPLEAHTWFERRRYGWHFPVLCLIGVFVVMGAALFNFLEKDQEFLTRINVSQVFFSFLSAPLVGAAFMALQFAGRDAWFVNKSRFVHVRPLSGNVFAWARARVLAGGVARGMVFIVLGIFFTFGIAIFVLGTPASVLESSTRPSLALSTVFSAANALFTETYSSYYELQPGTGIDNLWIFIRYGIALAALFMFANRYVLSVFGLLVLLSGVLYLLHGYVSHIPNVDIVVSTTTVTLAPLLLLALTLWGTLRSGALSARGAMQVALTWLGIWGVSILWIGIYYFSNTPVMAVMFIPFGGVLAVALCGPLAMAMAFDAKRSGSWIPPRRAGAQAHWGEAKGLLKAVGIVVALILVGVFGWRATVKSGVTEQLRLANQLGVGPRSAPVPGPEDAWRLSNWDLSGLLAAQEGIRVKFEVEERLIQCDASQLQSNGVVELVVPTDGADLPPEEAGMLNAVRSELERAGTATHVMLEPPKDTGPATLSPPEMLTVMRGSAAQCVMLALLGAEQRDPDLAFSGLRGGTLILRGLYAEPTLDMALLRADGWRGYAVVLERVLDRIALRPEHVSELLQLLPVSTSPGQMRNVLRVAPQLAFWGPKNETKRFGFRGYYGTNEELMKGLVEEALMIPTAAYGKALDSACDIAVSHDRCMAGDVGAERVDRRRHAWEGIKDYRGHLVSLTTHTHAKLVASHEQVHLGDAALGLSRAALMLEQHRSVHGTYPDGIEALTPAAREAFPKDWSKRGKLEAIAFRRTREAAAALHVAWTNQVDDRGAGDDLILEVNRP